MERSKSGNTVYFNMSIWYNEETGDIHMAIPDSKWFVTTVNDKPDSKRQHSNLYGKLARYLWVAGAPHPNPDNTKYFRRITKD